MTANDISFIEKFGLFMEKNSIFPRIAGRIYAYLLICNPPHQSANDLVKKLDIAKSSVSSMMRLLLQSELVEEMNLPGKRSRYYCIKKGAWEDLFLRNIKALTAVRTLISEGLRVTENEDLSSQRRLQELDLLYAFFEKELPSLIKRWEQFKAKEMK